jgi:CRP-like cAMP-binding protein
MWDLLLNSIAEKGVVLAADEAEIVKALFSHKKLRKHQYILQEGEVATHDNFMIKGLARTYRVDEKGQEHILRFTPEGWWAGDMASFLAKTPTLYNVDCLEDTEILRISFSDLETLYEKVPAMNKYFRILYQKSIISFNARVESSLSKTAAERYQEFMTRYPQIHQRVPDHQIASYLGITPQSLSRIRSQSVEKKR